MSKSLKVEGCGWESPRRLVLLLVFLLLLLFLQLLPRLCQTPQDRSGPNAAACAYVLLAGALFGLRKGNCLDHRRPPMTCVWRLFCFGAFVRMPKRIERPPAHMCVHVHTSCWLCGLRCGRLGDPHFRDMCGSSALWLPAKIGNRSTVFPSQETKT